MVKVSVIVPVHNTESYLRDCVASIMSQTLQDIEVVLVENASTDNSLAVCHELAGEDDRIRVLHLDQGGLSLARNEGVKIAEGDYVAFIDSDDTIAPDMLESLYSVAVEHGLDLVNSNFLRRYDDKPDKFVYPETGEVKIMSSKDFVAMNLEEAIPVGACMMLFRKELFKTVQFPVNRYFEDRASTYKFAAAGERAAHVYKSFYYYYQRKGSICRASGWNKYRDWILADLERLDFVKNSEMFTEKEKVRLATKPVNSYFRKMRHLVSTARTEEERTQTKELLGRMAEIPDNCPLSMRSRLIRGWLKLKRV